MNFQDENDDNNETTPRNGPDQILAAPSIKSWKIDAPVELQMEDYGQGGRKPISVHSFFHKHANQFPDSRAMAVKRSAEWSHWTYKSYFEDCRAVAKSFIKLGLDRFNGVCIMGAPAPEWAISYFGSIFAGGIAVGIYTTNSADACQYIAEQSKAQLIVVQDEIMLEKILAVKHSLPRLKHIVQWLNVPGAPGVLSWPELLAIGRAESDDWLNERLSLAAINQCCSLIYTSGTTGQPKGVMLSQDCLTWSSSLRGDFYAKGHHVLLCYLPLSHIASLLGLYVSINGAMITHFAPPDAMKGALMPAMQEVQPTLFFGVPRVWEKIYDGLKVAVRGLGAPKLALLNWARYHEFNFWDAQLTGRKLSNLEVSKYNIAEKYVMKNIRSKFGLGRVENNGTGAAPIDRKMFAFLMSFGLCLNEGYGMSESTGVCSVTEFKAGGHAFGSTGKVTEGMHAKLSDNGAYREGEGELCQKGRHIFMGYLDMPEKTHETIGDDGWMRTGDIARFDDSGFLFITGRIKELIITAGGENIPPVLIEEKVKTYLPFVSNAMLVGDKRKFLTILLTLQQEVDSDTMMPSDALTEVCQKELLNLGLKASTMDDALEDLRRNGQSLLTKAIHEAIQRYNANDSMSNAQKIQKWALLPNDFSLPTGELNSTLKLKRDFVLQKYKNLINGLYCDDELHESKL